MSPIEGTTRDAIEVALDLGGIPVVVVDTAGLRASSGDVIEQVGMDKARSQLQFADVSVWG